MNMKNTILTIGTFDGVHLGHQRLLNKVFYTAKRMDLHSIAITYDGHPAYVLHPEKHLQILTPTPTKKELILACGIDEVVILPFTEELSQISALTFLHENILKQYNPAIIVVGHDSHFGHKRLGTYSFLKKQRKKGNYDTIYVTAIKHNDKPISSTMIRNMLTNGDLDTANMLLNRPYRINGKVIAGKGLGKTLGFPTANLLPLDSHQLIPRSGIYFSKLHVKGKLFFGLTNIGISPTLKSEPELVIESYIIDFDEDIYGEEIGIEMIKRIRDEKKFASKAELTDAMRVDLSLARQLMDYE